MSLEVGMSGSVQSTDTLKIFFRSLILHT